MQKFISLQIKSEDGWETIATLDASKTAKPDNEITVTKNADGSIDIVIDSDKKQMSMKDAVQSAKIALVGKYPIYTLEHAFENEDRMLDVPVTLRLSPLN